MMENLDGWYDTSNFDPKHRLFSTTNKRVLGKCKSETADSPPTEFCGLRSKMYSLYVQSVDATKSYRKVIVSGRLMCERTFAANSICTF